jgi:hypothetical protein
MEFTTAELATLSKDILSITFVLSGGAKLFDVRSFQNMVIELGITSSALGRFIAWVVPLMELSVALLLLVHATSRGASFAAVGLLLLFTSLMGYKAFRKEDLKCTCFGDLLPHHSPGSSLVRNAILLLIGVAASFHDVHPIEELTAVYIYLCAASLVIICLMAAHVMNLWPTMAWEKKNVRLWLEFRRSFIDAAK